LKIKKPAGVAERLKFVEFTGGQVNNLKSQGGFFRKESDEYGFSLAEILCGGLSIEDSQIDDNDRKQQKFIHRNMFSCQQLGESFDCAVLAQ